ncbi:MAG: InlB B-repeat-containing protein [Clostridiales bacterium]|nr:InlB B-repeat-containing protein [Clostridiales bacterium]
MNRKIYHNGVFRRVLSVLLASLILFGSAGAGVSGLVSLSAAAADVSEFTFKDCIKPAGSRWDSYPAFRDAYNTAYIYYEGGSQNLELKTALFNAQTAARKLNDNDFPSGSEMNTDALKTAVEHVDAAPLIKFVVPEAVYLNPQVNGSGNYTFQFFVNNNTDGSARAINNETTGRIYVDVGTGTVDGIAAEMLNGAMTQTYSSSDYSINVSAGGGGSDANSVPYTHSFSGSTKKYEVAFIRWTLSYKETFYKLDEEGNILTETQNRKAYAYTYVYNPYYQVAGGAGRAKHSGLFNADDVFSAQISWWQGVHGYDNSTGVGRNTPVDPDGDGYQYPKTHGTGDNQSTEYYLQPLVRGVGIVGGHHNSDGWLHGSDANSNGYERSVRYTNHETGVTRDTCGVDVTGYTSLITVDSSRYASIKDIPNLKGGTMITDCEDHKKNECRAIGLSTYYYQGAYRDDSDYKKYGSDYGTYMNLGILFQTSSYSAGDQWINPIDRAPRNETFYFVTELKGSEGNYDAQTVVFCPLRVTAFDKGALRSAVNRATFLMGQFGVNGAVSDGSGNVVLTSGRFNTDRTESKWSAFCAAYSDAVKVLTKLDGTVSSDYDSQDEMNDLAQSLQDSIDALCVEVEFRKSLKNAGNTDGIKILNGSTELTGTQTEWKTLGAKMYVQGTTPLYATRSGYNFAGWTSDINSTDIDPDAVLGATNTVVYSLPSSQNATPVYAKWQPRKYQIRLSAYPKDTANDGEGFADHQEHSVIAVFGQMLPVPDDVAAVIPERTGYDFTGYDRWDGVPAYNYDASTNTLTSVQSWVNANDVLLDTKDPPNDVSKNWIGNDDFNENSYSTIIEQQYTLYGRWKPKVSTVTLDVNNNDKDGIFGETEIVKANSDSSNAGDSASHKLTAFKVRYNEEATNMSARVEDDNGNLISASAAIEVPVRAGYTFDGWYGAPEGGTKYFDSNGEFCPDAFTGNTINRPKQYPDVYYNAYIPNENNSGDNKFYWRVAADTTLYAHWTPVQQILNVNDGGDSDATFNNNILYFANGKSSAQLGGVTYSYTPLAGDMPGAVVSTKAAHTGYGAVKADLGTGKQYRIRLETDGTLDVVFRDGDTEYKFYKTKPTEEIPDVTYWLLADDGSDKSAFDLVGPAYIDAPLDFTFTAQVGHSFDISLTSSAAVTVNTFYITDTVENSGADKAISADYYSQRVIINPLRRGYDFLGWQWSASGMEDLTSAISGKTDNFTFDENGFVKFSGNSFVFALGTNTLIARWRPHEYTVTYSLEENDPHDTRVITASGTPVADGKVSFGSRFLTLPKPEITDSKYLFDGWYSYPDPDVTEEESVVGADALSEIYTFTEGKSIGIEKLDEVLGDSSLAPVDATGRLYAITEESATRYDIASDITVYAHWHTAKVILEPNLPDDFDNHFNISIFDYKVGDAGERKTVDYAAKSKVVNLTYTSSDPQYVDTASLKDYFDPETNKGNLPKLQYQRGVSVFAENTVEPLPTYDGYDFAGWYTEKTGGYRAVYGTNISDNNTFNADNTLATISSNGNRDITLYARWTPKKYTVTLNWQTGVQFMSYKGSAFSVSESNIVNKDGEYNYVYYNAVTQQNVERTFEKAVRQITVTYNSPVILPAGGGQAITVGLPRTDDGSRTDNTPSYDCIGYWDESGVSAGRQYIDEYGKMYSEVNEEGETVQTVWDKFTEPAGGFVLYAHWACADYKVSFDRNGATSPVENDTTSVIIRWGDEYPIINLPERTGYDFAGYFDAEYLGVRIENGERVKYYRFDEEKQYYDETGPYADRYRQPDGSILAVTRVFRYRDDITLVASWSKGKNHLVINPNGGTWNYYGTAAPDEWSTLPGSPYYKLYTDYRDSYVDDNPTYLYTKDYGTSIRIPVPRRQGYTFVGWQRINSHGQLANNGSYHTYTFGGDVDRYSYYTDEYGKAQYAKSTIYNVDTIVGVVKAFPGMSGRDFELEYDDLGRVQFAVDADTGDEVFAFACSPTDGSIISAAAVEDGALFNFNYNAASKLTGVTYTQGESQQTISFDALSLTSETTERFNRVIEEFSVDTIRAMWVENFFTDTALSWNNNIADGYAVYMEGSSGKNTYTFSYAGSEPKVEGITFKAYDSDVSTSYQVKYADNSPEYSVEGDHTPTFSYYATGVGDAVLSERKLIAKRTYSDGSFIDNAMRVRNLNTSDPGLYVDENESDGSTIVVKSSNAVYEGYYQRSEEKFVYSINNSGKVTKCVYTYKKGFILIGDPQSYTEETSNPAIEYSAPVYESENIKALLNEINSESDAIYTFRTDSAGRYITAEQTLSPMYSLAEADYTNTTQATTRNGEIAFDNFKTDFVQTISFKVNKENLVSMKVPIRAFIADGDSSKRACAVFTTIYKDGDEIRAKNLFDAVGGAGTKEVEVIRSDGNALVYRGVDIAMSQEQKEFYAGYLDSDSVLVVARQSGYLNTDHAEGAMVKETSTGVLIIGVPKFTIEKEDDGTNINGTPKDNEDILSSYSAVKTLTNANIKLIKAVLTLNAGFITTENQGDDNDNPGGNNDDPGNNDNPGGNNDNPGGNNDNPGGTDEPAETGKVEIINKSAYDGKSIGYKQSITFRAKVDPATLNLVWSVKNEDGKDLNFTVDDAEGTCTVNAPTRNFTVAVCAVGKTGVLSCEREKVRVKQDFFAKLLAFFRILFRLNKTIVQ